MSVLVTCRPDAPAMREAAAGVERYAKRMLRSLGMQRADLSLLVCDDATMRRLNHKHRKLDRPTDVLAFAMGEGTEMPTPVPMLGDIVISLPTATRQAAQHGWPVRVEVCLLLAHGLLHLLGFDHRDRTEERRMMARTHMLMMAALPRRRRVDKPRSSAL